MSAAGGALAPVPTGQIPKNPWRVVTGLRQVGFETRSSSASGTNRNRTNQLSVGCIPLLLFQ
jgi:hypothetical protein